jgi:hypothetical protein
MIHVWINPVLKNDHIKWPKPKQFVQTKKSILLKKNEQSCVKKWPKPKQFVQTKKSILLERKWTIMCQKMTKTKTICPNQNFNHVKKNEHNQSCVKKWPKPKQFVQTKKSFMFQKMNTINSVSNWQCANYPSKKYNTPLSIQIDNV